MPCRDARAIRTADMETQARQSSAWVEWANTQAHERGISPYKVLASRAPHWEEWPPDDDLKISDWREHPAHWVRMVGYALLAGLVLLVRSCVRG